MARMIQDELRPQLGELLAQHEAPCVSIYLPTFRGGAETAQNPIRFKNALRQAEDQLAARGLRPQEIDDFLAPVRDLDRYDYWQRQSDGLAVFRGRDLLRELRLPRSFAELVVVNDRFYLKPLFPLLYGNGHFYVLALSVKQIRLFEGHRDGLRELDLGVEVPKSLTAALGDQVEQPMLQLHANSPSAIGRTGSPRFHGHGGGEDDVKPEIQKFFNLLDNGLARLDLDRGAPLVLAGVEYLLPLYREVTSWPNLAGDGVTGNFDRARPEELHTQAWRIVAPRFREEQDQAAERYRTRTGTGLGSSQLDEVLAAAHDGRVDTLFTARGARLWGTWDPQARQSRPGGPGGPGGKSKGEDLLDLAAVQTFLHGGRVFNVEPDAMPAPGERVAAIFRY